MNYGAIPTLEITELPDPLPEDVQVLDVREDLEWVHGHIAGATHIPLMDVPRRLDELGEGRTVVVCKMGGRSAQAVAYLQSNGVDAINLGGGMLDWAEAGRPMVSENGAAPHVV